MKLATLFEPRRHVARSMRAELDAVSRGTKPIAMEAWPAGALDADHARFVALARARGLAVVERREPGHAGTPLVAVYALRPAEAWRIDALHALWRVVPEHGWSDGAEALESHLLGYTPAQIARWLAAKRHERLGWQGVTIYLLLQRGTTRATAVWCAGTRVLKRKPPAWVAKRGLQLARAAIAGEQLPRLFPRGGALRSRVVDLAELEPFLVSQIELLGGRGWRR